MKKYLEKEFSELERPVDIPTGLKLWKKGLIRIIIIYPDQTYKQYVEKIKNPYYFKIGKDSYFMNQKCFLYGEPVTGIWYFKNPMQIGMTYEKTKVTASVLNKKNNMWTQEQHDQMSNVVMDTEAINTAMTSNVISKIYDTPFLTGKMLLIILGAVMVFILIILQATGKIDVFGFFSGG